MSFFGSAASTSTATQDKDIEVVDPPPDSISSLAFSPVADYLAVGSWDNNVRVVTLSLLNPGLLFSILCWFECDVWVVMVGCRCGYMK